MKKLTLSLFVFSIAAIASAQVPQALNYQAVARNSMGQMIASQNIGVRFSITDASGSNIVYQETHSTITNSFGLFTLAIGKGAPLRGGFADIDWGTGEKFLKVEIAPKGGTNYTLQGITQLLSAPYALYAEKTRLVAGDGIKIGKGNTISGNYVPGSGIDIDGNVISARNAWLMRGNAGTTAANFLGTTDNVRLNFKTNNITRMYVDKTNNWYGWDVGSLYVSDEANVQTRPGQISLFGREIVGGPSPLLIANTVMGQSWGLTPGNTLGRLIRFSQMNSAQFSQSHFYDLGISQDSSFYLSNHWFQNGGPTLPKKMITISNQDRVGINMAWAEKPTANFHTKGSLRFEGINTNNTLTRILAMDANGNVSSRDVGTLGSGSNFWTADVNGINNNNTGHVGIGGLSSNLHALTVSMMENTIDGRATAKFVSNDTWQTNIRLDNTTTDKAYSLVVGGTDNIFSNYGVGLGNFGIVNGNISGSFSTIPLIITGDNKVGISNSIGGTDNLPKSRLHIREGDVYIDQIGSGVIMKSPNGQCWRMTVSDAGTPVFTAIPCP